MAKPWVKGQSGNPSGYSKQHAEVKKYAQQYTFEAIDTLVAMMRDKKNRRVGLKATEIILDRALGKVPNTITGEAGEGPVKFEVSWRSAEVAQIDITPREEVPLLAQVASPNLALKTNDNE